MKSGLEGRNNGRYSRSAVPAASVSMKSGLEGRNNVFATWIVSPLSSSQ